MSTPIEQFEREKLARINAFGEDLEFQGRSRAWLEESMRKLYVYNFTWLGRPIIQNPTDVVALQEIIWRVRPSLIIETGIAHGGSLIFSASMLELLAACGGPTNSRVLGVDIDIRPHNRQAIEEHPLRKRISMLEGSSISQSMIAQVHKVAAEHEKVLVCLDSNHTHAHVLAELEAYAPLTTKGSYCVVFDTFVEDMPEHFFPDRPWDKGNNPKTAVWEYLRRLSEEGRTAAYGAQLNLKVDRSIQNKLLITVAPDGYLFRV